MSLSSCHYRTSDGHEVDMIIEDDAGCVLALEVKAGAAFRRSDLRGLAYLRDRLGDRFRGGILSYPGHRAARLADRLFLAPIDALWTPTGAGGREAGATIATSTGGGNDGRAVGPSRAAQPQRRDPS